MNPQSTEVSRSSACALLRQATRIFLAYAHSDYLVARDVRRRILRLRGPQDPAKVFLDQDLLTPAERVSPGRTLQELERADLAVVLCGRDTPTSINVRAEIRQALDQQRLGRTKVLPVIIGYQRQLPEGIRDEVQGIFLTNLFPPIRWWRWAFRALLLTVLLLLPAVALLIHSSGRQKAATDGATLHRFASTIGTADDWPPSAEEREALWELAELPPGHASLRTALLTNWLQTPSLLARAVAHDARGLQAAIGLQADVRSCLQTHAKDMADVLATGKAFHGDIWQFVAQVNAEGIPRFPRRFLYLPLKRPECNSAIGELEKLGGRTLKGKNS